MPTQCNRASVLLIIICVVASGCTLVKLKQDLHESELLTVIVGYVSAPYRVDGPIIVAAYSKQYGNRKIEHYTVLHDRGEFEVMVAKGTYYVFAFIDQNSNLIYDEGEPAGQYGEPRVVIAPAGGVVSNINIVIPNLNKPIDWPIGHNISKKLPRKLYSRLAGAIVDIDDERFSDERGSQGFWEPSSFYRTLGGTIFFLEAYDPDKIPILFIHGAGGTPKGWKYFADNIDRTRFQPWFFYYPSGSRMRSMSHLLYWKLLNLQMKYNFNTLYITAHSMGGLIARSFIQDFSSAFPSIQLFISLATPWGGDKMAEYGVKQSPVVIPSWIDMQPEGDFIQSLYRRKMPDSVSYYMFYGHRGNRNPFRPNNDGTITLSSLLDRRPQADAKMSYAFDEDHTSIINSKEVLDQYNMIINTFDAEHRASLHPSVGFTRLNFTYNDLDDEPQTWSKLILRSKGKEQYETVLVLGPESNGKVLGPFPCGDYRASIIAESIKPQEKWTSVSIESNHTNELNFVFTPDGVIAGYLTSAIKPENKYIGMPSWEYLPEDNKIQFTSIILKGAGVNRTLPLLIDEKTNWIDLETSRTDYFYNGYLRLFGLPAGEYELTVKAEGHETLTIKGILVTPGIERDFAFWELTPDK